MKNLLSNSITISNDEQIVAFLNKDSFRDLRFYFFCKNRKGKYLGCNDYIAQDVGLNQKTDMLGFSDFDLCWKDHAENFIKNDAYVMKERKPLITIESAKIIRNDNTLQFIACKFPLKGRTKKIIGTFGVSLPFNNPGELFSNMLAVVQLNDTSTNQSPDKNPRLTNRQIECLFYLTKGMTAKEIANTLGLSTRTVEHYLDTIKSTLNCSSRSELISKALTMQVIKEKFGF